MLKAFKNKYGNHKAALASVKARGGVRAVLREEGGAIDLASIMVGVIIVGVLSGVIAAAVFGVIPWAQDNAAKQALDSVVTAESSQYAMSAAKNGGSQYATADQLAAAGEDEIGLQESESLDILVSGDGKKYFAISESQTGKVFTITDKSPTPVEIGGSDAASNLDAAQEAAATYLN